MNFHNNNKDQGKIKKIKKEKKCLRHCINKDIFEYLLNLIDETETDDNVKFNKKVLNLFLYYTGLRLNELLHLNKQNLLQLFNQGKLNVYCKKTGDYRNIFLQSTLKIKFIEHLGNANLDRLDSKGIVNKWGNKLSIRTAAEWMDPYWDELQKQFGGDHEVLAGRPFGFHSYRVNFINQVIRSSDLDKASKIIGHKNPVTTLIYFRRFQHTDNEIVHALDNANF